MALNDIPDMVIGLAIVLPIVLILAAFLMGAEGELRDYHFGVAVEVMSWIALFALVAVRNLAPDVWREVGDLAAILIAASAIAIAGVCGAIFDAVAWVAKNVGGGS